MRRLLWLLPVGLLQACAGTPVAEQLERSFAVPEDTTEIRSVQVAPVQAPKTSPTADRPAVSVPEIATPAASSVPTPAASSAETQDLQTPKPKETVRPSASQPQPQEPYRITIRLAGANPAAPAEAVTRALREADVGFAVERIERVDP